MASNTFVLNLLFFWNYTIYNCVFSFSFLALVVSEILGGPKITLGGPVPPERL